MCYTQETKLIAILSAIGLFILSLLGGITYLLGWGTLGVTTALFLLSYPLIWALWKVYSFWYDTFVQLSMFTQTLQHGKQIIEKTINHSDSLSTQLKTEIEHLSKFHQLSSAAQHSTDMLLNKILDSWPIPVILFNSKLVITYRNTAMVDALNRPILIGQRANDIGFSNVDTYLSHNEFNANWQSHTVTYQAISGNEEEQNHWLFYAINISHVLNQKRAITQQQVIRVLAHEIRNSLTPMQSMTDTLLSTNDFSPDKTQLVLGRINQRSKRLLTFIQQYSQLSTLPAPSSKWFKLNDVIHDAKLAVVDNTTTIDYEGNDLCFGDIVQISQVMINILKNAQEAIHEQKLNIKIRAYSKMSNQVLEIEDNGPGFTNLKDVLVPFYTTKPEGSGIGLALCAEIINNHGGQLTVDNGPHGGAHITMIWPINKTI